VWSKGHARRAGRRTRGGRLPLGRGRRAGSAGVAVAASVSLLLVASPALAVDGPTRADVQRALERVVDGGAPGVTAVIRGPGGLERYSAGSANLRSGRPISPRDHGRVGSVTKSFTATLVLQLAAEGKLGLEDSVQMWLPGVVPNGDRITVRQLLNHSSGIADYCSVPLDITLCEPSPAQMARRWTPEELVAIGVGAPPTFPPGQGWSYTNTDYVLLGRIIERATGHTLGAEYERRIFRPLGLGQTSFPASTSMPRPFSRGYDVLAGGTWPPDVTTATSPTIAWSAGAIVSTPGDLQIFMRALLRGRLVSRSLLGEMKRPAPGSLDGPYALEGGGVGTYGLGLIHYTWSKACGLWGHTGAFPGYRTIAVSNRNGRRGAAMYITSEGLAPPGAVAGLEAERLLACRMRFGRIGS
jgi:D-alanyl-D-alanine carboxypeptidase